MSEASVARGKLYVIAAPSGAGKTTLVRALIKHVPTLRFSISYTTRKPRPNEQHGRDYFFVDHAEFERMAAAGEFLEHARVFDNYYGTSKPQVEGLLRDGENVLLEIDWQGAQQIRRALPECESIFILPPSRAALEQRLRGRQTDNDEVIARRLRDSIADMSHWNEFDYVVVNDDFERATAELQTIVGGRGLALRRDRSELQTLLPRLLG
ncbi:MAG: guanylate kinase [Steroidobacter sp.]|nr:guanylate kinase [Steroidobacter sp.]MBL8271843.1 guanylate kinase [Steroidobacter sp.]